MVKIVILNLTHFENKGSMGRIEGMLNCLEKTLQHINVKILHRYYNKDKDTSVKNLLVKYPYLEIKDHPWFKETSINFLTVLLSLIRFFFLIVWRKSLSKLGLLKDEINQCDIIIDLNHIEPDKFTRNFSITGLIGGFLTLLNTWFAIMSGKPVFVCSATIGPYHNIILRRFATYVLQKVDIITLREKDSQDYLQLLGVNKPLIYLSADLAFLLEAINNKDAMAILSNKGFNLTDRHVIGIAPTEMMHPFLPYGNYVKLIAEISDYLIEKFKATILYIVHTYQDLPVSESIYQKVKNKDKIRIISNLSASEIKGIIGICDLFIGSRFHALVGSTSLGIPSLSLVAYSQRKFNGIIGDLMGQKNYLLEICDEFEYNTFFNELKLKVDDLWMKRELVTKKLNERNSLAKDLVLLNGRLIKELINTSQN